MMNPFFLKLKQYFAGPRDLTPVQKNNFANVQIDAIGVGIVSAAAPFLPVFLTRLGATTLEVGLLTSMPGLTGLLLSLPLGIFLQSRKKIVAWFSASRLLVIMCYALTGLLAFLLTKHTLIVGILIIWALATIPQTALNITFSVVMNAVAGPSHRFDLMSRRWSILGISTAIMIFVVGQVLDKIVFPLNFRIVFIVLSIGGLISFIFSNRIHLPELQPKPLPENQTHQTNKQKFLSILKTEPSFTIFVIKRFVFLTGQTMAITLLPLFFVREVKASDSWIASINMASTLVVIIGYFLWTRQSRQRGSRPILIICTFGVALWPMLASLTRTPLIIVFLSGLSGLFQAGINLVFFDELMKTIPPEYSATYVSIAQGLQYISSVLAPIIGTFLAEAIGFAPALIISGSIQLCGFLMFLLWKPQQKTYHSV